MLELNKVMLIGNLTRDPELSYMASGTALAKMGVAVNRRWKDKGSGEMKEETSFIDVQAWGHTAEFCSKWLKKGKRIYVEGRLKQDRWEAQDGSRRSKVAVTADRVEFADSRASEGGGDGGGGYQQQAPAPQRPAPAQQPPAQPPAQQASPEPGPPPAQDEKTADDLPF